MVLLFLLCLFYVSWKASFGYENIAGSSTFQAFHSFKTISSEMTSLLTRNMSSVTFIQLPTSSTSFIKTLESSFSEEKILTSQVYISKSYEQIKSTPINITGSSLNVRLIKTSESGSRNASQIQDNTWSISVNLLSTIFLTSIAHLISINGTTSWHTSTHKIAKSLPYSTFKSSDFLLYTSSFAVEKNSASLKPTVTEPIPTLTSNTFTILPSTFMVNSVEILNHDTKSSLYLPSLTTLCSHFSESSICSGFFSSRFQINSSFFEYVSRTSKVLLLSSTTDLVSTSSIFTPSFNATKSVRSSFESDTIFTTKVGSNTILFLSTTRVPVYITSEHSNVITNYISHSNISMSFANTVKATPSVSVTSSFKQIQLSTVPCVTTLPTLSMNSKSTNVVSTFSNIFTSSIGLNFSHSIPPVGNNKNNYSTAEKVGIGIGIFLAVLFIALFIWLMKSRKSGNRRYKMYYDTSNFVIPGFTEYGGTVEFCEMPRDQEIVHYEQDNPLYELKECNEETEKVRRGYAKLEPFDV